LKRGEGATGRKRGKNRLADVVIPRGMRRGFLCPRFKEKGKREGAESRKNREALPNVTGRFHA